MLDLASLFSFLQSGIVLQSFFGFYDLDTFEDYMLVISQNVPQFGGV